MNFLLLCGVRIYAFCPGAYFFAFCVSLCPCLDSKFVIKLQEPLCLNALKHIKGYLCILFFNGAKVSLPTTTEMQSAAVDASRAYILASHKDLPLSPFFLPPSCPGRSLREGQGRVEAIKGKS